MSKQMLDVVKNLIKTRDALAKMEDEVKYLRRVVDGSVNDIVDWLKDNNIITVKDDDDSEREADELEQSMVDRGSAQEGGTGADGEHKSWDTLQD